MSTVLLKWNDKEITQGVLDAFQSANDKLAEDAAKELTTYKWPWPNTTVRKKDKKVIGTPRDAVDIGQLRGSHSHKAISPQQVDHTWAARHAMAVHEGAKLRNGGIMPARPFTIEPLKNFKKNFLALARQELDGIK